jgi:hypothetical protein
LFKEIANLFVILRNSGDYVEKWKGEYRGEERRGEERRENESRNTILSFIKLLYLPT